MAIGNLVTRTGVEYAAKLRGDYVAVGAVTNGPFKYGETVTQATSLATGVVAFYEPTRLYLRNVVGTFNNSAVITGGTSGATATASAVLTRAWFSAWVTVARLRDTVSIGRTRDVTTITDFDTAEDTFADQIVGNQQATMTATMNIEPGGTTFQIFEAAVDSNWDVAIKRTLTDRAGTGVRLRYYTGVVSDFSETDSVNDASTVSFSLALNDSRTSDPTA